MDRYAEALRLIGPQIHVPEQISCKHVESTLLRTADGILVSHKNGPYNDYKHGQALYGELNVSVHHLSTLLTDVRSGCFAVCE